MLKMFQKINIWDRDKWIKNKNLSKSLILHQIFRQEKNIKEWKIGKILMKTGIIIKSMSIESKKKQNSWMLSNFHTNQSKPILMPSMQGILESNGFRKRKGLRRRMKIMFKNTWEICQSWKRKKCFANLMTFKMKMKILDRISSKKINLSLLKFR